MKQSNNQQSINQTIKKSKTIKQSNNQSINQSIKQSNIQSINESNNQKTIALRFGRLHQAV